MGAGLAALGGGLVSRTSFAAETSAAPATAYAADFILNTRYADIPAEVIELARKSILDGLGLALSGSVAESGGIVRRYLTTTGLVATGPNAATVIGSPLKAPVRFAAFANGVGIHADDYDDTQLAVAKDRVYGLLTHPTAPALPPALAICETRSLSGRDLLLAYNIGVEVETKIGEAISPRHYEDGFHSTGTAGVFGAASASAKLYGLDRERILRALGIAGSEAAGLRENFGPGRRKRSRCRRFRLSRMDRDRSDTRIPARLLPGGGRRLGSERHNGPAW